MTAGFPHAAGLHPLQQVYIMGRDGHADRFGGRPRTSGHHPCTESSPTRRSLHRYMTICRAQRGTKLRQVSCQNKARSTRLRFRTLPIHPTSKPERPGVMATDPWASVASDPHTVRSRLSEPSGGGLVRGAASRWCCHLLGTSSQDPYVAYVSRRYAAGAMGGLRESRRALVTLGVTSAGKGLG